MKTNSRIGKKTHTLAAKQEIKRYLPYAEKAISQTRKDIKSYTEAENAMLSDEPKNFQMQLLIKNIMKDALLTSQVGNRKNQPLSAEFSLKNANGEKDEEQTAILKNSAIYRELTGYMLDAIYYDYSLVEIDIAIDGAGELVYHANLLPRENTVPQRGLFYYDYTEDTAKSYREMPEFGTWILEFDLKGAGLLSKAIPHVLFKRFAQSCWSELCEIYGIPPRVMKTNTQDSSMLNRAEQMMQDMGAAAYFIIDETEQFEFANAVSTKGEVYDSLMGFCDNQNSLLISGAIIGQDTKNGSKGKELSSQDVLWQLVQSDMAMVETFFNSTVLNALANIGMIKAGLTFEFDPVEDLAELWARAKDAMQYYSIDPEWIKTKFGIEVTGERQATAQAGKLSIDDFFV